ncbi:MAG: S-layer homology domain-containing protein [Peptococcaceae bacterium]|nr:S-layer homology domain-containing protein [Peptococcaceae bacterium]
MKQKKLVSVLVLFAFAVTMICPVSAFAASFTDVSSDHWAIQQVERMNARGIIVGYPDGTNKPGNPVTQFEALTMATRMMGLEYDEATHKGTYVPFKYPDWTGAYSVAVLGQEAGLVDVNDFSHSSAASREWIAKLLIKILDAEGELSRVAGDTLSFGDAGAIGSNYVNYVKLAYDKGLIGGYTDGTFKPKNTVTRAEMAAFMCRVEDKLNKDLNNVVRGEVTAVNGVNVTISGNDGKSYSLYATTNSVLFSSQAKQMGVTGLKEGDSVYAVYKNSLLLYLEQRAESAVKPETVNNVTGTIESIIAAKNAIVVLDTDGELKTVLVDNKTTINKYGSTVALDFADLMVDMPVRMSVSASDQTASQIIIEETASGQRSGTVYSVDVYNDLIIMDEKTELATYRMAKNIDVSISGMLTATPSSLKEGDMATYTISDGVMTAIAVGGSSDAYGGNATVKSIDTANRIITYTTSANELKAAYYNSGQAVKFKNGDTGTISDLQAGDSINISVSDNKVTSITVTGRNLNDGAIKGTLYAVNTASEYIIITNESGSRVTYDLDKNAKVTLYGSSASLSSLTQGMKVELTMQGNKVTRIKANDMVEGVVKAISTSAQTITVTTSDGTRIYDVATDLDVHFYRTTSYRLSAVSVGDTVSMKVKNDEVTEININEQVDMTIDSIYSSSDWIRLADANGNKVSADLDEAEFYIDGSYTSDITDFSIGDSVVATFAGSTLIRVEAVSQVKGEVTKISGNTLTVKTSSGNTRTVTFGSNSQVVKNGSTYSSLSQVKAGDRIIVGSGSASSKVITVMKSKTGDVRYATSGLIRFLPESDTVNYKAVSGCYCHYKNSTTQFVMDGQSLTRGDSITIYYTDINSVYEVVKN